MRRLLSSYLPGYAATVVYMLQNTEYQVLPYLKWYWRTRDFRSVMYRRSLDKTKAATLLLGALSAGMLLQSLAGLWLVWQGSRTDTLTLSALGALAILTTPVVWAHLITVPLIVARWLLVAPRHRKLIKQSESIFAKHPGTIIAIAGSYGKTSMKELLTTVLGGGQLKIAATPANKNVPVSHAIFANRLEGDEDVLLIEYGEGKPGDVARFARTTHPNKGVITGLAPAHLDQYKSLKQAGDDIFSLADYVGGENTYVNGESEAAQEFITADMKLYNDQQVMGWKISAIKIAADGIDFKMEKSGKKLMIKSGLLGRHQVGPLALAAALAESLGMKLTDIEKAAAKTRPFEHRMQPYGLGGAQIIDDTYNGNIDGMKAGLALLGELPAKRKIYVTPGLVDQGVETERVHVELGKAIAAAQPDRVVLMHNSATNFIQQGMRDGGYKGALQVEHYPLDFYVNLNHIVAAGDLVLMQNDWTDNYT